MDKPRLAPAMRLQKDRITGESVLLGPEVAVQLTESAVEILSRCDGARTVDSIAEELGREFDAPSAEIAADAAALLARLAERGYIQWASP